MACRRQPLASIENHEYLRTTKPVQQNQKKQREIIEQLRAIVIDSIADNDNNKVVALSLLAELQSQSSSSKCQPMHSKLLPTLSNPAKSSSAMSPGAVESFPVASPWTGYGDEDTAGGVMHWNSENLAPQSNSIRKTLVSSKLHGYTDASKIISDGQAIAQSVEESQTMRSNISHLENDSICSSSPVPSKPVTMRKRGARRGSILGVLANNSTKSLTSMPAAVVLTEAVVSTENVTSTGCIAFDSVITHTDESDAQSILTDRRVDQLTVDAEVFPELRPMKKEKNVSRRRSVMRITNKAKSNLNPDDLGENKQSKLFQPLSTSHQLSNDQPSVDTNIVTFMRAMPALSAELAETHDTASVCENFDWMENAAGILSFDADVTTTAIATAEVTISLTTAPMEPVGGAGSGDNGQATSSNHEMELESSFQAPSQLNECITVEKRVESVDYARETSKLPGSKHIMMSNAVAVPTSEMGPGVLKCRSLKRLRDVVPAMDRPAKKDKKEKKGELKSVVGNAEAKVLQSNLVAVSRASSSSLGSGSGGVTVALSSGSSFDQSSLQSLSIHSCIADESSDFNPSISATVLEADAITEAAAALKLAPAVHVLTGNPVCATGREQEQQAEDCLAGVGLFFYDGEFEATAANISQTIATADFLTCRSSHSSENISVPQASLEEDEAGAAQSRGGVGHMDPHGFPAAESFSEPEPVCSHDLLPQQLATPCDPLMSLLDSPVHSSIAHSRTKRRASIAAREEIRQLVDKRGGRGRSPVSQDLHSAAAQDIKDTDTCGGPMADAPSASLTEASAAAAAAAVAITTSCSRSRSDRVSGSVSIDRKKKRKSISRKFFQLDDGIDGLDDGSQDPSCPSCPSYFLSSCVDKADSSTSSVLSGSLALSVPSAGAACDAATIMPVVSTPSGTCAVGMTTAASIVAAARAAVPSKVKASRGAKSALSRTASATAVGVGAAGASFNTAAAATAVAAIAKSHSAGEELAGEMDLCVDAAKQFALSISARASQWTMPTKQHALLATQLLAQAQLQVTTQVQTAANANTNSNANATAIREKPTPEAETVNGCEGEELPHPSAAVALAAVLAGAMANSTISDRSCSQLAQLMAAALPALRIASADANPTSTSHLARQGQASSGASGSSKTNRAGCSEPRLHFHSLNGSAASPPDDRRPGSWASALQAAQRLKRLYHSLEELFTSCWKGGAASAGWQQLAALVHAADGLRRSLPTSAALHDLLADCGADMYTQTQQAQIQAQAQTLKAAPGGATGGKSEAAAAAHGATPRGIREVASVLHEVLSHLILRQQEEKSADQLQLQCGADMPLPPNVPVPYSLQTRAADLFASILRSRLRWLLDVPPSSVSVYSASSSTLAEQTGAGYRSSFHTLVDVIPRTTYAAITAVVATDSSVSQGCIGNGGAAETNFLPAAVAEETPLGAAASSCTAVSRRPLRSSGQLLAAAGDPRQSPSTEEQEVFIDPEFVNESLDSTLSSMATQAIRQIIEFLASREFCLKRNIEDAAALDLSDEYSPLFDICGSSSDIVWKACYWSAAQQLCSAAKESARSDDMSIDAACKALDAWVSRIMQSDNAILKLQLAQTCVAAELSRQFLVSLLTMDAFSAIALSPAEFSKEIAAAAEGPAGSLLLSRSLEGQSVWEVIRNCSRQLGSTVETATSTHISIGGTLVTAKVDSCLDLDLIHLLPLDRDVSALSTRLATAFVDPETLLMCRQELELFMTAKPIRGGGGGGGGVFRNGSAAKTASSKGTARSIDSISMIHREELILRQNAILFSYPNLSPKC